MGLAINGATPFIAGCFISWKIPWKIDENCGSPMTKRKPRNLHLHPKSISASLLQAAGNRQMVFPAQHLHGLHTLTKRAPENDGKNL